MTGIGSQPAVSAREQAQRGKRAPEVLAAVDLGSNSFHMKVARHEAGRLVVVDRLREMVRLAEGLHKSGRIEKAVQQRALACLGRFGQRIRDMHADTVRIVATNTFRKARKAAKFKRRAEKALGHPIEVVSGREEARLVYLGVVHSSPKRTGKVLVVDIGGGSTELIIGEGLEPKELFSLQMGCVSLTRRFFADGKLSNGRLKKARLAANVELEPVLAALTATSWEYAIGASGTIRAAAQVLRRQNGDVSVVKRDSLAALIDRILAAGSLDKLSLPGLDPARAPVFPGGVIVLETVFEALGIESMQISDGALREGILFDLVGRMTHEDARERSVAYLQSRYNVETAQAGRVEHSALELLTRAADGWKLRDPRFRLLMSWAARTHELGLAIAHSGYHRHGGYLLAHSDLPGFSTDEQAQLAALVSLHRKSFEPRELESVHPGQRAILKKLAVILRLAVVLHRQRAPDPVPIPEVRTGKGSLRLRFQEGWLDQHPLTRADLELESRYLSGAGVRLRAS